MNCQSERSEESKQQANGHNACQFLMPAAPPVNPAEVEIHLGPTS